jgi:hypothetical protein
MMVNYLLAIDMVKQPFGLHDHKIFFILLMVCQVGGLPYMAIVILSRLAS